jgi:hypothetical protein
MDNKKKSNGAGKPAPSRRMTMEINDLLSISYSRNVDIKLHLPDYEDMKLILVGGAITTQDRFDEFEISLCHLNENGVISRYGQTIGNFSDIEVFNIIDAEFVHDIKRINGN